eukprot:PLAT1554.1.p1 GENE.PLAT1554.1~~PLAT1554.1.p1  ORF type:complete len:521 (+),score=255.94 PLAT1554.1:54-1616(+)
MPGPPLKTTDATKRTKSVQYAPKRRSRSLSEVVEAVGIMHTVKAIWHLFPILILQGAAMGMVVSILPGMTTDYFTPQFNHGKLIQCSSIPLASRPQACSDASAQAAFVSSIYSGVSSALLIFSSPFFGALSDVYGRRGLFILSQVAPLLPAGALIAYNRWGVPLTWYFVLNAASSLIASSSLAIAYAADKLEPEHRAGGFALVLAAFATGIFITPLVGATVSRSVALLGSFAMQAFSVLMTVCMLPESLKESDRSPFNWAVMNPLGSLGILFRCSLFRRLTLVIVLTALTTGYQSILLYYMQGVLGFGKDALSLVLMVLGVAAVLIMVFVAKPLIAWIGERNTLKLGLFVQAGHLIIYTFARREVTIMAGVALAGLSALVFPSISGLKSNNTTEQEQGTIQGALYGANSAASGLSPFMFGALYKFVGTKGHKPYFPGSVFLLGAALNFVAFLVALALPEDGTQIDSPIGVRRGRAFEPAREPMLPDGEPRSSVDAEGFTAASAADGVEQPPALTRLVTRP